MIESPPFCTYPTAGPKSNATAHTATELDDGYAIGVSTYISLQGGRAETEAIKEYNAADEPSCKVCHPIQLPLWKT